ncbi:MAG TPA: hypothetical protein VGL25_04960 [Casimicrobiaceae bacterium]|jgi:hypothetical protein
MNRPSTTRKIVGIAGLAALVLGPMAVAGEIRISGGDCTSSVGLVARDARLSDVLKRLAQTLDFQLSFEAESDPVVSVSASRDPIELLTVLAPSENISVTQARNPRCPYRDRIIKVWVLPKGQKTATRAPATQAPPNADTAAEQAKKAQQGADMILRSHGIPTSQPEEQDPDNPH